MFRTHAIRGFRFLAALSAAVRLRPEYANLAKSNTWQSSDTPPEVIVGDAASSVTFQPNLKSGDKVYCITNIQFTNDNGELSEAPRGARFQVASVGEDGKVLLHGVRDELDASLFASRIVECPEAAYEPWQEWTECEPIEISLKRTLVSGCAGIQHRSRRLESPEADSRCPLEQRQYRTCVVDLPPPSRRRENTTGQIWPDLALFSMAAYSRYKKEFEISKAVRNGLYAKSTLNLPLKYRQNGIKMKVLDLSPDLEKGIVGITSKTCSAGLRWRWVAELCHDVDGEDLGSAHRDLPGAGLGDCASIYRQESNGAVAISFRGTDEGNCVKGDGDWQKWNNRGTITTFHGYRVHTGFLSYYQAFAGATASPKSPDVSFTWGAWLELASAASEVWVTGHSLGGAAATMHMIDIESLDPNTFQKSHIVTFGAPRLFGKTWAVGAGWGYKQCFQTSMVGCVRVYREDDFITRWPSGFTAGKLHAVKVKSSGSHVIMQQKIQSGGKCTCDTSAGRSAYLACSASAHSAHAYFEDVDRWASTSVPLLQQKDCDVDGWIEK